MRDSYQSRAKQFLPYASLRGFEEIVAERRKIKEERREPGPDAEEEISYTVASLCKGDFVRAMFYKLDRYIEISGEVVKVDPTSREIVLNTGIIPIDDLFSIEKD